MARWPGPPLLLLVTLDDGPMEPVDGVGDADLEQFAREADEPSVVTVLDANVPQEGRRHPTRLTHVSVRVLPRLEAQKYDVHGLIGRRAPSRDREGSAGWLADTGQS